MTHRTWQILTPIAVEPPRFNEIAVAQPLALSGVHVGKSGKYVGSLRASSRPAPLKRVVRLLADESGKVPPSVSLSLRPFLSLAVLVANLQSPRVALALLISLIAAMLIFALVSADVIHQMRRTECQVRSVFEGSEREFHQMAYNIQEIFWVIDPETRTATYVNPAYEAITGRSCQSLIAEPSSYERAIHPEDRAQVLANLEQAAQSGHFDERLRIVRPDG